MKTFLLFIGLFLICLLIVFNLGQYNSVEELLKTIMATLWAYILYNLIKEEYKN